MTASHGLFELQVEADLEKVLAIIEKHPAIDKVVKDHKTIIATLNKEMSASKMNKYLFDNDCIVSHLVKRKPSLEQQFLDLTNNN